MRRNDRNGSRSQQQQWSSSQSSIRRGGTTPFGNNHRNNHHMGDGTATPATTNAFTASQQAPTMEPMMRCMTFVQENTRIAFACYDEEKNEIVFEESRVPRTSRNSYNGGGENSNSNSNSNGGSNDNGMEGFIEGFQNATRPNLVLVSSKIASNTPLLEMLTKKYVQNDDGVHQNNDSANSRNTNTDAAKQRREGEAPSQSHTTLPYQLLKSKSFDIQLCKHVILTKLRVMSLLKKQQHQRNQQSQQDYAYATDPRAAASTPSSYHSLASVIDFDSSVLLRAVGSLLIFLQNTLFKLEEGGTITVHSISHIQSCKYMKIDATTLHALHIFNTEHHPLMNRGGGGRKRGGGGNAGNGKEGFSLFSLLDRTKSKIGRARLREWMLQPLLSIPEIVQRQDGVELFLQQQLQSQSNTSSNVREIGRMLEHLLGRVGAVDRILWRMQRCHSVPMDFITLSKTLEAAVKIVTMLNDLRTALVGEFHSVEEDLLHGRGHAHGYENAHVPMVVDDGRNHDGFIQASSPETTSTRCIRGQILFLDRILHGCNTQVLQDLHQRIISIVDEEATLEKKKGGGEDQKSVVIHYGFHEELDNAKEAFDHLDGECNDIVLYFQTEDALDMIVVVSLINHNFFVQLIPYTI